MHDLSVHFPTEDGLVKAVDGISFAVERGETLGIVGESGSGKSVTSQAIMGLHKGSRARVSGQILFEGRDLVRIREEEMRLLRGKQIAMIFQDPLSALHPYYTVGNQIVEAYRVHNDVSKQAAKKRTIEMLDRVGIPNPDSRFSDYPHQFSGGMRQRAMIAMALVCDPHLLIADEPTTALDVTVQAQILELMKDLQREFDSAIILITHDLGVVAETCDNVVVMYGGQCVEYGGVDDIFYKPEMPYTWGLLTSMPRMDRTRTERLNPISGQPPSLINVPSGCVFNPRCAYREHVPGDACVTDHPDLLEVVPQHAVRCHIDPDVRRRIWSEQIRPSL
ncbi:MAG: ABC transporter ATP-binding protein [Streptosporangiales bacterium]|nr:ABC transporter ATP-binding protein [Streptosporangiales bacterium]